MKKLALYAVLATGVLGMSGSAIAASPTPKTHQASTSQKWTANKEARLEKLATLLGIPAEDLKTRLAGGKTIPQIMGDLGVNQEVLHTKMMDELKQTLKTRLQEKVAKGEITQQQADEKLQKMTEKRAGKQPEKSLIKRVNNYRKFFKKADATTLRLQTTS